MTMIQAMNGAIGGATAAQLMNVDGLTGLALKVNHLALVNSQTFCAMGKPIGLLETFVSTTLALMPLAIIADLKKVVPVNIMPFTDATLHLNNVYQTGIAVNCVVMLIFGNPVYALASLCMLALNTFASGQLKDIVDSVKKGCSALSLVSIGSHLFATQGALSMAPWGAVTVGVKGLLSQIESVKTESSQSEVANNGNIDAVAAQTSDAPQALKTAAEGVSSQQTTQTETKKTSEVDSVPSVDAPKRHLVSGTPIKSAKTESSLSAVLNNGNIDAVAAQKSDAPQALKTAAEGVSSQQTTQTETKQTIEVDSVPSVDAPKRHWLFGTLIKSAKTESSQSEVSNNGNIDAVAAQKSDAPQALKTAAEGVSSQQTTQTETKQTIEVDSVPSVDAPKRPWFLNPMF